eukprot:6198051-Pleurochrysis_carterae.AAC.3
MRRSCRCQSGVQTTDPSFCACVCCAQSFQVSSRGHILRRSTGHRRRRRQPLSTSTHLQAAARPACARSSTLCKLSKPLSASSSRDYRTYSICLNVTGASDVEAKTPAKASRQIADARLRANTSTDAPARTSTRKHAQARASTR